MPGNSIGQIFRITTFGESHGKAVGVVVDGVEPGIEISTEEVQKQLDRRKTGQSSITTDRKEPDIVHFMSGMFEGLTTGTPILMILYNKDAQPSAYEDIKDLYRPGHADFTYKQKYGFRDWRGSGRASGRETAARVAAGALAQKILATKGVRILAYTRRTAGIEMEGFDPEAIERNPLRCPDMKAAEKMNVAITMLKEEEDSMGGVVECRATGVRAGLGEPVFDKLDAELAHAMLSIGAIKGIEFGAGFSAADMRGSEHNDEMNAEGFMSNNAGGIIGGISTGNEILFRVAVKPTSSISRAQRTVDTSGQEQEIRTIGRHDACICPRIVPVVEAMTAIILLDHYKRLEAQRGGTAVKVD